jgi:hypothetical protein
MHAGVYGYGKNTGSGPAYGGIFETSGEGSGDHYGGSFKATGGGIVYGVRAEGIGALAYGIYATSSGGPAGKAGYFAGSVQVTGMLSKGGGSFQIDHPLDPANKYLYHSFVESPDMKNIYDGVVLLDDKGEAWVDLPNYFDALNKDFRYQVTCVGAFAPVFVADEIEWNRFRIAGGTPGLKVCWQVTGTRKDAFANANRIVVETEKELENRGKYLHPLEFGLSESAGIDWQRNQEVQSTQAHAK